MNSRPAAGDWAILVGQVETNSSQTSDAGSLVDAARGGDQEAFRRLYEIYAPVVHGILLARAPSSEVEDLVQEVFVSAFKQLPTLRDKSAFGGWIAMIARNRAVDSRRRLRETEEVPREIPDHGSVNMDSDARARKIVEVIRRLPEAYGETLALRLVEGMTGPEIAERTGLTPASVRVNLHRGMKLLRDRLLEEGLV
jgi:RNA polymerase sigma-70 factor (ECF subfamily)